MVRLNLINSKQNKKKTEWKNFHIFLNITRNQSKTEIDREGEKEKANE